MESNAVIALVAFGIVGLLLLVALMNSSFTIHTKQAGLVERLGKFNRIAAPGLNFKLPFIESLVYVEELSMQLMDVPVMSKTMDDATVNDSSPCAVFRLGGQSEGSLLRAGRSGKAD